MATDDYSAALEEAILLDADQPEDISFGKDVAKNFAVATATSAGVFGAFVVIALVAPAVTGWFNRKKNPDIIDGEFTVTNTPDPEKV